MITPKQLQVLRFVDNYISENAYSPGYREISEEVGGGVGATHRKVQELCDKGLLRSNRNWRSIEITKRGAQLLKGQRVYK